MKHFLIIHALFNVCGLWAQTKGASPLAGTQQPIASKNTYAVVVGISDYQDKDIPDLRFADKDAEAFANYLRSDAGGKLDHDHLKVLINSNATMAQFANALDWLWESCREGDQAIIYFSGHGDVEKKSLTQPGFLLCWDAPARVYMAGGAFALPMLQEVVSTLSVQNKAKVIVITDACRSGTLAGSSVGGAQATASSLAKQFGNEIKIMSCQPNEYSIEGEQWGGGRGAFSYHLLDALYGMADNNKDLWITLQEVGRYLEDHVTNEVAPVSQVPMIVGNRNEHLTSVNEKLLASIKSGKTNQMMLSAIESRGIEEDVLAKLDTTAKITYQLFKTALKNKNFLPVPTKAEEPERACAEYYYQQLIKEPKLERLQATMKRNYAAALQDDAQQVMNIWLAADVQQLQCIGKSINLEQIPQLLDRASTLLGDEHYMHRSLEARKFLFQGINLLHHVNPDEVLARQCLPLFEKSMELEPQSPLPLHRMCMLYMNQLRNADSAFICAEAARNLAPNWVLPYSDLSGIFCAQKKLELAKKALLIAEEIDSVHPYVINQWALLNRLLGKKELALTLMNKYKESGGPVYPCWYNDYAMIFLESGKFKEAEEEFHKALAMDSTNISVMNNLGSLYNQSRRFDEAEQMLKKVLSFDSTQIVSWNNLGSLYNQTRRFTEAEPIFKRTLRLDSSQYKAWNNLGFLYIQTQRFAEAESALVKSITLDSSYTFSWNNLGGLYILSHRYADAKPIFNKVISLDSMFANPHKHLGMAYFKTGQPEEARKSFLKAISLNSNYSGAMLGMAYTFAPEGKTDEAITWLEMAIKNGSTWDQLEKDEDLSLLRNLPQWKELMAKYFPNKVK
ncbi:MAG: tetratricopeptide repeat protein [Saprospiraceae bacterium]|nr:tetratricopeptide repeat protein [Saprospiraceae bacterium]